FGNLAEFGAANGFRILVGIDALDEVSTADAVHENARDTVDRPAGGEAEGQDAGFLQGRPGGNILIPIGRDGLADLFVGSGGEPQPVPRVDVDRQAVEATFVAARLKQALVDIEAVDVEIGDHVGQVAHQASLDELFGV